MHEPTFNGVYLLTTDAKASPSESVAEPSADVLLVERCRAGDAIAWQRLYDGHFGFAWNTARRLGLPESEVEDVVQESFLLAHQHLGRFHQGRFSTWLFRIISNAVANRHRRRRVRDFFTGMFSSSQRGAAAPSPEAQVGARLELEQVAQVLARMSAKKREVFALFELEGLPHDAIAERLGIPSATVRTRLFHARTEFNHVARQLGVCS